MINLIINFFLGQNYNKSNVIEVKGKNREITVVESKPKFENYMDVEQTFIEREKFYKKLFTERFCI